MAGGGDERVHIPFEVLSLRGSLVARLGESTRPCGRGSRSRGSKKTFLLCSVALEGALMLMDMARFFAAASSSFLDLDMGNDPPLLAHLLFDCAGSATW